MKGDISRLLFNKYLGLNKKTISVVLRDGRTIEGAIVGFVRGNRRLGDPYILKWHLVNVGDEPTLGMDMFGNRIGELILQRDVKEMYFYESSYRMIGPG